MRRSLVVKCTAGVDDPERCNQAFTVAATALSAGATVSLWLTGDAVLAGGTLTVCTQCAARRNITEDEVLTGVRIAGSASFVEEVLRDDAQALVY